MLVGLSLACTPEHSPSSEKQASVIKERQKPAPEPKPTIKKRQGGLDVTFLVASDTHIGYRAPQDDFRDPVHRPIGIEKTNLRMIDAMNTMAGRKWPAAFGGQVKQPLGVLISGDLTENGGKEEWGLWTRLFGFKGKEGPLQLPVYEGAGNHDRVKNWYIREQVAKRHGGRHYFFDWQDLRVVCLGEAPDEAALKVLAEAFRTAADDVPFVLFFHFPLQGPFSENWFSRAGGPEKFAQAIEGHRVLGIFHGHYHATGAYRWRGVDVYNVGSPKYVHHSFSVVRVTDTTMSVAEWDYDMKSYSWWHQKPVALGGSVPQGREIVGVQAQREVRPEFTLKPR